VGFASLEWRLRATHARALAALGRTPESAAEQSAARDGLQTLAARLPTGELREAYLRQPVAAGLHSGDDPAGLGGGG
jgi:hypothetical protein